MVMRRILIDWLLFVLTKIKNLAFSIALFLNLHYLGSQQLVNKSVRYGDVKIFNSCLIAWSLIKGNHSNHKNNVSIVNVTLLFVWFFVMNYVKSTLNSSTVSIDDFLLWAKFRLEFAFGKGFFFNVVVLRNHTENQ